MNDAEIAAQLADIDSRSRSNTKRLDRLEAKQDALEKLSEAVAVLAERQGHTEANVMEIKADVKTLTEKPGKRWDKVVDKIILGIVGALIVALLIRLGLPA